LVEYNRLSLPLPVGDWMAQDDQIIIRPVSYPRQGWDEAFQAMAERRDDQLLDGALTGQTRWDQKDWQW